MNKEKEKKKRVEKSRPEKNLKMYIHGEALSAPKKQGRD
jgi:hypothetical protein